MTKDQYLEDLYQELQKYQADNTLKHVTEYDYIISDMLEETSIEEVIEKLGTSQELAQSIAEEFGYELKNTNQFEDPIINRKKRYTKHHSYELLAKVINILFVIGSIIFFLSYTISVISGLTIILIFGAIGFPLFFWILTLLAISIFVLSIYMLVLNLKNLLINNLVGNNQPLDSEVN